MGRWRLVTTVPRANTRVHHSIFTDGQDNVHVREKQANKQTALLRVFAQALNSKEIGDRLNIIERLRSHATKNVVPRFLRFCYSRGVKFFKCFNDFGNVLFVFD